MQEEHSFLTSLRIVLFSRAMDNEFWLNSKKILINNHKKTIRGPVKSECCSFSVHKNASALMRDPFVWMWRYVVKETTKAVIKCKTELPKRSGFAKNHCLREASPLRSYENLFVFLLHLSRGNFFRCGSCLVHFSYMALIY